MEKYKLYHLIAGLVAALIVSLPCLRGGLFAGLWGCLAGVIAGATKEWCDMTYGGRWDWRDFAFTCIGVGLAMVVIVMAHLIF